MSTNLNINDELFESALGYYKERSICLIRPPFFTPWSPPLGIALLKSFLEKNDFRVRCVDLNVDSGLWSCHHKYFTILQDGEMHHSQDGYSKLWFVLNAHMLAFAIRADESVANEVVQRVAPYYGLHCDESMALALTKVVKSFFGRLGELLDQFDLSQYSTVGTSTYSTSLAASLFLLKKIKSRASHIRTVMGGGVFFDDLALGSENLETLLTDFSYIDHVVLGEGELLFLKLVEGHLANQRVVTVKDLGSDKLDIKDVSEPSFDDLNLDSYFHLAIEGGRSCPFQCTFCSETVQWGSYRKKPKELFVNQILQLSHKYKNNRFFLSDSLVNPYIEGVSTELLRRNADVLYDGYLRADKLAADGEKTRRWAESGFYRARLGIETASASLLEAMDKRTDPSTISCALKSLSSAGIRTTTYWIVGHPSETEEDFEETLRFIEEHRDVIYELEAHPFYYYPYGQVASRLYRSQSIYPDEVTDVIRFKEWEVTGCNPGREQRFHRLARISERAQQLGIPNIYTMSQRYEAEDRWLRLHPNAVEVY